MFAHVQRHCMRGLVRYVARTDDDDRVVVAQDLLDRRVGVYLAHSTFDGMNAPTSGPGTLDWRSVSPELVAEPVAEALATWGRGGAVLAALIDPDLADTAAFCEQYGVELADSANCVVIAGKRGGEIRYAACVVLATTRADVNGVVRKRLDARKASFASMDDAVSLTSMEYGGITPIGLPAEWPVLVDAAVLEREMVVIGSGLRRSKIALASSMLADLPTAEVIDELAG